MHWYLDVLKNYAGFGGRARRQEFWMYTLFNFIAAIIVAIVSSEVLGNTVLGTVVLQNTVLSLIYALAVLLPSLAVTVRRLHDTGRSGGWLFIALVPLVGFIILLVFLCLKGEQTDNAHGVNPKLSPAV